MRHLSKAELEAGVGGIEQSPRDEGRLELIVRRPVVGEREVISAGELSLAEGLVGDSWAKRASSKTTDGSAHPDMQLNIMNSRAAALVAGDKERWPLAGDQLYCDFDLSEDNVPAGTRLSMGAAVVEVTALPHTGCHKFIARFGQDAGLFVNSTAGRKLRLRGINAKVIQSGKIKTGDIIRKISQE